uniref:Uncharacterized protein n=1 Tax=Nucleocytoviricota sp. TaxID=2809609 RepID=A0A9E8G494_9VIRU|nr:hypothetical protein [Nucleocytoviricota sp.]UZT29088.1 hypothetical protein [Nucleocytoviricota sp.]
MSETTENQANKLPPNSLWKHISKISISQDKPIMLDYWLDSLEKKVAIGVRENGEKLLVKSEDEYTSTIKNLYCVDECYIICTENSIYITSSSIPKKRIS